MPHFGAARRSCLRPVEIGQLKQILIEGQSHNAPAGILAALVLSHHRLAQTCLDTTRSLPVHDK